MAIRKKAAKPAAVEASDESSKTISVKKTAAKKTGARKAAARSAPIADATAIQRGTRQSPYKMRLVIDQIRGKDVNEALALLTFSKKHAALQIAKTLRSPLPNGASWRSAGPRASSRTGGARAPRSRSCRGSGRSRAASCRAIGACCAGTRAHRRVQAPPSACSCAQPFF